MRDHALAGTVGSIGRGRLSIRLLGFVLALITSTVAFLGVPAAQAANSYVPSGEISAGELTGPARIAVDTSTGNVLVVDTAKNRVDVFDSSGPGASLLTTFGEGDLSGPYGIAIDQSNGNVYVTDPGNELIRRYVTDGAPTPTYTLDAGYAGPAAGSGSEQVGSFTSAIAVDPTNANLLVADRGNDRINRFSSAGAFVSSFNGADSGSAFTHLEDVALSPAGKVFVSDGEAAAGAPSRVLRLSNAGAYEATLRPLAETGDAYLAYNPARPGLVVGDARECFFCTVSLRVLDPTSGAVLFNVAAPSERVTGLAIDPGSGRLYAASAQGEAFAPPKVAVLASQMHPELVLNTPSPTSPFNVHLTGTVNPEGVATEYHFEVSKDGGTTWLKSSDASAGEGTSPVAVAADLAVEPNTDYIAKLVATNTEGAQDATATQPFTTAVEAPATVTQPASDLAETSAVINGTINPYGLQTTYYFEYGPTTAYGTKVPAGIEATAGNGTIAKTFSRTLSGLTPGATYHFRLVATSSAGTAKGDDQSFATRAATSLPVRAYEQVTPADKGSALVTAGIGFTALDGGNAVSYLAKSGPASAPVFTRLLARRGSTDWQSGIGVDPPLDVTHGAFMLHLNIAVSADSTHAFVVTNQALAPGAVDGEANLYRTDLITGDYEFVGGSGLPNALEKFTGFGRNDVFQAGNADLSEFFFHSLDPLLPEAPLAAMYRWTVAGGLELASVLPNGEAASVMHQMPHAAWLPASSDLSRFYFTALDPVKGLYLREGNGDVKLVSHLPGDPNNPRPGFLLGTNEDGRYAFFVSGAGLTSDAPGFPGDLYRYDASDEGIEYLGANVWDAVAQGGFQTLAALGVGADGETIYFNTVSGSSGVEADEPGGTGTIGSFSVWHEGLVHTIQPDPVGLTGERFSPSGRYFAFLKEVDGVIALYRYDAEADESRCVSCLPDGTPVAANLAPGGPDYRINNRNPGAVNDDGTVYFDTVAALVKTDVNGKRDVYAWNDGAAALISPGTEPFDAILGDVTSDGSDVFFTTTQALVARDTDKSLDVYDAKLNGGLPIQNTVPAEQCLQNCKAPPIRGEDLSALGSETVAGNGNAKPGKVSCRKGRHKVKVRGKTKCVKNGKKQRAGKNQKERNR